MKLIRNIITIIIVMLLVTIMLCGNVHAASSIKASKSSITVGNTVSITVSFGQKESSAQFKLNYDTSKFDYVSCSAGSFGTGTNTFVYVNYEDVADLGSVTLTFKSKQTGTGTFSISGVVLSSNNSSISTGSTSVKVEKAASNSSSSSNSTTKPSTNTNKKPTTSSSNNSSSSNQNTVVEENEPEVVVKLELNRIKQELQDKVETDYTEESWRALQEAIVIAENAATNADYDAIKEKLSLETLQKVTFETTELDKVLRDLIGKVQTDYTAESWNSLQEAINVADSAQLKSEYEVVKDKLTVNTLILDEKTFLEDLLNGPCEHGKIIITLVVVIVILFIIIIVLLILNRKAVGMGRRTK